MKVFDYIIPLLMTIVGAIICGIPHKMEFNLLPLGIVFIILGIIMILWELIDGVVDRVITARDRKTDVIINLNKPKQNNEKKQDCEIAGNWESAIDALTQKVQDEIEKGEQK